LSDKEATSSSLLKSVLLLVEGRYDIRFLTLLARQLHQADSQVPDLEALQASGRLLFIPTGGNPQLWTDRLAPLSCREIHLYDRESEAASSERLRAAALVNARHHCVAYVTSKRSLENYLHPQAIEVSGGGKFEFDDFEDVGELVARDWHARTPQPLLWSELTARARSRLIQRAKKWLNSTAVQAMTAGLLEQRDPQQELRTILRSVGECARLADAS
jgi:putative ATP-dependent endonuclease of OLD family